MDRQLQDQHVSQNPGTIAFAFDIDGVIVRGKKPIPGARDTISALQKHNVPFIFLTNSGGLTESKHVSLLGQRLNLKLDEDQFVQSHTPFRDLVPMYWDKLILALGGHGQQIRDLAHAYGFEHVLTSWDILKWKENIHPFPELTSAHHEEHARQEAVEKALQQTDGKVKAIFIFSSPRDWCLDLQVITDLLLSSGGQIGTRSPLNGRADLPNGGYLQDDQPELFFCNPDIEWSTSYPEPRLAQGSFCKALEGVWHGVTKMTKVQDEGILKYTICGKPTLLTYRYGEKMLQRYRDKLNSVIKRDGSTKALPKIRTVYMIGDNPASDIMGANSFTSEMGATWKSILVETGVYKPGTVLKGKLKPTYEAMDIKDAVEQALAHEGIQLEGLDGQAAFAQDICHEQ